MSFSDFLYTKIFNYEITAKRLFIKVEILLKFSNG